MYASMKMSGGRYNIYFFVAPVRDAKLRKLNRTSKEMKKGGATGSPKMSLYPIHKLKVDGQVTRDPVVWAEQA